MSVGTALKDKDLIVQRVTAVEPLGPAAIYTVKTVSLLLREFCWHKNSVQISTQTAPSFLWKQDMCARLFYNKLWKLGDSEFLFIVI